jgi:NADH-quinone oxidoreductase subunit J
MAQSIFYILAVVAVIATLFAITERHAVHAIIYLVTSFFSLAAIFFLLGAPVVAMFEVIIYAGAIMVLFMFVIMMLDLGHPEKSKRPGQRDWWPALILAGITFASLVYFITHQSSSGLSGSRNIGVSEFALALFRRYGIAIELISMQLLFAIVGALYLGRRRTPESQPDTNTKGLP